jgi:single-stranded DNA-binding protein
MGSLTVGGIARITRDPETRSGSAGTWYSFGISCYRRNALAGKQNIDFFEADLYVKAAGLQQAKFLAKGKLIYIENAYLRNDEFTGNDGNKKSRVKLQIVSYELLNDKIDNIAIPGSSEPVVAQKLSIVLSFHPSDLPPPLNVSQEKERFIEEPIEEYTVSDKTDEIEAPF